MSELSSLAVVATTAESDVEITANSTDGNGLASNVHIQASAIVDNHSEQTHDNDATHIKYSNTATTPQTININTGNYDDLILRHFTIYETKTRLYVVGSNRKFGRYRIIKIDRTISPPTYPCTLYTTELSDSLSADVLLQSFHSLGEINAMVTGGDGTVMGEIEELGISIVDDGVTYTLEEMRNLMYMIQQANKGHGEMRKVCEAAAIAGVVRFVQGYYLVAITAKTTAAVIGGHTVYSVDETQVIPILNSTIIKLERKPEETNYVAAFQAVCFQNDFYFSYTYDITRTLQVNMQVSCSHAILCGRCVVPKSLLSENSVETKNTSQNSQSQAPSPHPETMFMWNYHMRKLVKKGLETGGSLGIDREHVCRTWTVTLVQGFVRQTKITVFSKPFYITLIARRSRHFAGARFLRRGIDTLGRVANEVESEQIVHDASLTVPPLLFMQTLALPTTASVEHTCPICFGNGVAADGKICVPIIVSEQTVENGQSPSSLAVMGLPYLNKHYTSFVQHRGSIPLYWSQDTSNLAPKPPIQMDKHDPFYSATALHFDDMFRRYGSPLHVLNLVKTKEKVAREAIIGHELELAVKYLSQLLPEGKAIHYQAIDMSRVARTDDVMAVLEKIGHDIVAETGFFHGGPEPYLHTTLRNDGTRILGRRQCGVVRTNCIDCLDRTNAAAFIFGKCALGLQLHALGVVSEPTVSFDTDIVDILTDMYQSHGDVIALQYGGSNLVNTMESYRNSNFASHSRDMIETIRRYYSNSFTDAEKQDAIDLYLGLYSYPTSRRMAEHRKLVQALVKNVLPTVAANLSSAASFLTGSTGGPHRSYLKWWTDDPDLGQRKVQSALVLANHYAIIPRHLRNNDHYTSFLTMFAFNMMSNLRNNVALAAGSPFTVRPRESEIPTIFNIAGLKRWLHPITSPSASNPAVPTIITAQGKNAGRALDTSIGISVSEKTPVEEQKSSRKKAIENLVDKLSDPSVTIPEMKEYKRYVQQFQADIALAPSMPMIYTTAQMRSHPDYYHFASCVRLSESPSMKAINVQEADSVLYEEYVKLGDRLAKQINNSEIPIVPARLMYAMAPGIGSDIGIGIKNATGVESMSAVSMSPSFDPSVTDPWQVRSDAYSHWLKTGRLKTWKSKKLIN